MTTPGACARQGTKRVLGRVSRGHGLLFVIVLVLASALVAGPRLEQSKAVQGGRPSRSSVAQVRIFENGESRGGGTLVAHNWVLTALHLFHHPDNPSIYSLRFGVINDGANATDAMNLRSIDRIVLHPQQPDLAMVHFADPVPAGTWIPELAVQAPLPRAWAHIYGWGSDMHVLQGLSAIVRDPVAIENAEYLRARHSDFAQDFLTSIPPMVLIAAGEEGDSGSGVFVSGGVLAGVHRGMALYRDVNASGNLYGGFYNAAYEQPVWEYRGWIQSVINGEGSSGSAPTSGESSRRRLTDSEGNGLPMTLPPQTGTCEPDETSCGVPEPKWAVGVLLGSGNNRGTVLGKCAQAAGNSCSFNGTGYAGGATVRMPLGPSKAIEAPGTREVMAWCKASNTFSEGAPPQPVLRVSFTNADGVEVPVGYGWWDVMPDQVGTGTGQTPIDTSQLATC